MFYQELKRKREELGITLNDISARTKINKDILFGFENGDFSKLPDVYNRLFLKAYAIEVGEDPQKILRDYEEFMGIQNPPPPESQPEKEEGLQSPITNAPLTKEHFKSLNKNFTSGLVILIIIVFIIAILKQIFTETQDKQPSSSQNQSSLYLSDTTKTDTAYVASIPSELNLTILTRDTCWIKLLVDGKDHFEGNLPPYIKKDFKARQEFDLRVGRPGVLNLILNGRDLGPVGNPSIPTRVVITKDGIVKRLAITL